MFGEEDVAEGFVFGHGVYAAFYVEYDGVGVMLLRVVGQVLGKEGEVGLGGVHAGADGGERGAAVDHRWPLYSGLFFLLCVCGSE